MGERLEGDEAKTMSGKASSSVNVNAFGIGNGHTNTAQRQEKKVEEDEEARRRCVVDRCMPGTVYFILTVHGMKMMMRMMNMQLTKCDRCRWSYGY